MLCLIAGRAYGLVSPVRVHSPQFSAQVDRPADEGSALQSAEAVEGLVRSLDDGRDGVVRYPRREREAPHDRQLTE